MPGSWEGSLALLPGRDTVQVVGVVSGASLAPTVAWATLRATHADGPANVHFLPLVPARDGLWLGYGLDQRTVDRERTVVLVGGGTDAEGEPHSDVYAVDLAGGGDTELVVGDEGPLVADLGEAPWLAGERDNDGWRLRLVPSVVSADGRTRHGAYERLPGESVFRPAGLSATDTPRADITTSDRLARVARGQTCEHDGAPWYAPPGRYAFDDDPTRPVLACEQPIPALASHSILPRQVVAHVLGDGWLWTLSPHGLERWRLTATPGVAPERVAAFTSLAVRPGPKRPVSVLGASERLVALATGERLTVLRADATDAFSIVGELALCDEVKALVSGADEIWAVGRRHVTHLRVGAGGVTVAGTFELLTIEAAADAGSQHGESGDTMNHDLMDTPGIFAHALAPASCGGSASPGDVVSAAAGGATLAIAFERALVTLDLRHPSRLPTLGAVAFEKKLTHVATDGRFTAAHTEGEPSWAAFRSSPRSALDSTAHPPAHAFARQRSYAGRHATRLTGAALHVAVTAAAGAP